MRGIMQCSSPIVDEPNGRGNTRRRGSPRRAGRPGVVRRFAPAYARAEWQGAFDLSSLPGGSPDAEPDRSPGRLRPLLFFLVLATWIGLLSLGFGLMSHAAAGSFKPELSGFTEALYIAGSSLSKDWHDGTAAILHGHVSFPALVHFQSLDAESDGSSALHAVLHAAPIGMEVTASRRPVPRH